LIFPVAGRQNPPCINSNVTSVGSVSGGDKVERSETAQGNAAFGSYLKKVREGRRLSLDAVEELSAGFPEKVTKSHLSRIENGLALPSFPRLMALSHIYGMPIASLAERYELDLRRGMAPVDLGGESDEVVLRGTVELRKAGRHEEALARLLAIGDRGESSGTPREHDVRIEIANCLFQTGRYEFAKTLCENLLSIQSLSHTQRLQATELFAMCCMALGRYAVALMALEQVAADLDSPETPPRTAADLSAIRGNTYYLSGDSVRAITELTRAKQLYDGIPNHLESCRAGLMLSQALIETERYGDASTAIQAELVVAEQQGFQKLRSIGLSHLCLLEYRRGDFRAAEAHANRSNLIARQLEILQVVFRNSFYLWKIARGRDDSPGAKTFERSLRALLGRIESQLPESEQFREFLARGDHDEHA
jgi:transcriptional regulator with XRE-family HTH domain